MDLSKLTKEQIASLKAMFSKEDTENEAERGMLVEDFLLPHIALEKQRPNVIAAHMLAQADYEGISFAYDDKTGDFWRWNGSLWEQQLPATMKRKAATFDTSEHTNTKRVNETLEYLKHKVGSPSIEWDNLENGEIPLAEGVLNFMAEKPFVSEHNKNKYYTYNIDIDYAEDAISPTWLAALDKWFAGAEDKQERINALQEYMGYSLLSHAQYKKALLLVGESNSGKSRIEAALKMLLDKKLCCSIRLEAFNMSKHNFGLMPLIGAQVNFINEPSKGDLLNDGMFKQIVSGSDSVTIDRKNKTPWYGVPRAKHIIATNTMPIIKDESKGTWNRLLIIPFENVIPASEQDTDFDKKLAQELPGLLNWCIEGARRLVGNRGHFTFVPSGEERAEGHRLESNPLAAFTESYLVPGTNFDFKPPSSADIVNTYNKYSGSKRKISIRECERYLEELGFVGAMKKDGIDLANKARDNLTGNRVKVKVYEGYRLTQPGF